MNFLPLHSGESNEQQTADSFSGSEQGNVLPAEVRKYIRAALSENSLKAYGADLEQFLAWGGMVPASPEVVAHYLAAHAGHHAITTLARRLVAIVLICSDIFHLPHSAALWVIRRLEVIRAF